MTLGNILAGFEFQDDWEDRYRYVIEPGRSPAPTAGRGARGREQGAGLLQGLARDRRRWHRRGDRASSPLQGRQRRRNRARAYCQLGLAEDLTPQRLNEFASMVERIRGDARRALSLEVEGDGAGNRNQQTTIH